MSLSTVTVTFDAAQLLGSDFDRRRTKVRVYTNVENQTLIDTAANLIRMGDETVTINADGTGSFTTWAPGADGNPTSWQTYVAFDYPRTGARDRQVRTFGPYTITANADLADLEEEQAIPPAYLTTVTTLLDGYVTEAEGFRDEAEAARDAAVAAGLVWRGAWNAATAYAVSDVVSYGGASYRRLIAGTTAGTPAADATNWLVLAAKGDTGPTGAPGGSDAATAGWVTSGPLTGAALQASYDRGDLTVIYVGPSGSDLLNGRIASAPKKTLAAALIAMGTGVKGIIRCLPGDIDAGSGVSWTGYKCGIVGAGKLATRIVTTTTQVGPVIDMTGSNYDLNYAEIGGFTIVGDGTAGATKKGIAFDPDTSIVKAHIHDILIQDTGGACADFGWAELCALERIDFTEPVNAAADDIPYFTAAGPFNGNTVSGCTLHGISAGANVGASGAVVIKANGLTVSGTPHDNLISGTKLEYLHVPTNGTVFAIAGNATVIENTQVFDTGRASAATGTSIWRFATPSLNNLGGNLVTGIIFGRDGSASGIDCGVDMRQSKNAVVGVKGYRGTNVIIASGVGDTDVVFNGVVGAATDQGVIDNSGLTTNRVVDPYLRVFPGLGRNFRTTIRGGRYYGPTGYVPGTANLALNRLAVVPVFLPTPTPVNRLVVEVTTAGSAGSNLRLGVYTCTSGPTTGEVPFALLIDGGTVDATTTGIKEVTLGAEVLLPAGIVWVGCAPQGGGVVGMRTVGVEALPPVVQIAFGTGYNGYYVDSISGALPALFGSASVLSGAPKAVLRTAP